MTARVLQFAGRGLAYRGERVIHKWIVSVALVLASFNSQAEIIGGFDFPDGARSFADAVVSYDPDFLGGPPPSPVHTEPLNAIGIPDAAPNEGACTVGLAIDCPYVSLGNGGQLILQFTDNVFTGSGDNALDLIIFEVGAQVEATFVDVSVNGTD